MIRLLIAFFATLGALMLLGICFPSFSSVAFSAGDYSFTWANVGAVCAGILAYRNTK